ncbi:hypothetical protein SynPROS91_01536 [Synechococcus sp. PROS-9-1]|nr:hypothetical protein SynPROS91_01536 [Synechococcus sp. PROS-9-1]
MQFNENRSQSNPKGAQVAGNSHLLKIERASPRPYSMGTAIFD